MSHNEQVPGRPDFWTRLRENARSILEEQHANLQKQTCKPEHCLEDRDKEMMRHRQYLLDQYNRDIRRLDKDGCYSRVLALATTFFYLPPITLK